MKKVIQISGIAAVFLVMVCNLINSNTSNNDFNFSLASLISITSANAECPEPGDKITSTTHLLYTENTVCDGAGIMCSPAVECKTGNKLTIKNSTSSCTPSSCQ